jgi:small-conductance mechanosensitive channel
MSRLSTTFIRERTNPRANRKMALNPDQQNRLDSLLNQVEKLADELGEQPEALLALLRQLEQLHRTIQDGPFRGSLPADRNHLFNLLRQMEQSGGWPYIPRLQLRTFMDLLQREPAETPAAVEPSDASPRQDPHQLAA